MGAEMISKGRMFHVLDDIGYVKVIDWMGQDETIIEAARMSTAKGFLGWGALKECARCKLTFAADQRVSGWECVGTVKADDAPNRDPHDWKLKKGDEHLLEFLYKNGHHTPFEMCELVIEVVAPIFVFREWHRHRTQSFNEFSARYSQMPNEHYVPALERFEPKLEALNKQEASVAAAGNLFMITPKAWRDTVKADQVGVYENYESMINAGVPKEVARINTPVSRYSKMRAKTDLRNWLGFLKLRMDSAAQYEIRQYANVVGKIVAALWPRTWALFEEYTAGAVTLSRSEVGEMKALLRGEKNLPRERDYGHESERLSGGFLSRFK